MAKSKLLEMHNVGIVVESLGKAISFFQEIGLTLEGRMVVAGEWAGQVTGLKESGSRDCNDGDPRRTHSYRTISIYITKNNR